ncbi:MAG: DUF6588 family protein [Balneolaceae bacterium]
MFNSYKKFIKGLCALAVLSLGTIGSANAQLGDAGAILRAGAADANILLENYLAPFGKGFGADLNTGWFNTAKTHQTLGFDVNLTVSAAVVPTAGQVIDINSLTPQFDQLELTGGSSETPTISGNSDTDTRLGVYWNDPRTASPQDVLFDFGMVGGTGVPYVPAPMVQATIGVIKDTDVSLRFIPETEISAMDGSVGLFGFGLKHGINQWLPGGRLLPVDLSVQFGYTSFASNSGFEVYPTENSDTYNEFDLSVWEGQGLELETSATTFNVIAGKTLPFISLYGGVGLEGSTTTIKTPGSFPYTAPNENYDPVSTNPEHRIKVIEKIDSPIDINIDGDNSFRAFAGTRIKLAVFQISASYTLANYSSFNVGFGITFR